MLLGKGGVESTDGLGDSSHKKAIDMEGPLGGSSDFEKVPDINDFEDEDDSDRVCEMGCVTRSEWTNEPRRARHDNDVDEEEDDDVKMANEVVTESELESYGNTDKEAFAEDERLDNLNRVHAETQTLAQAWLEIQSAPSALERHYSSFPNEPQNMEPQGPTSVTAPGMSLSNTMSGEMSMVTKTRKVSNLILLKHLCIPRSLSASARTLAFKLR
ncbi:hypothetical protein XENOCAPTIV_006691 [Xenoophorus captivus]|uniref:Uncharacterized protein n=1 Tax=Xenoophorus captivus TaxID=1517983 RepID=A0ABV0SGF9_9TELE